MLEEAAAAPRQERRPGERDDNTLNSAVLAIIYYLGILAVSKFLAFGEVSLVPQHLIVDLVVDVEELGDDLPVL